MYICQSRLLFFQNYIIVLATYTQLATAWTVRGSNPGGGRDFPHLSRPALYNRQRVFAGGKERSGRDADPSPPSSAVVKKE